MVWERPPRPSSRAATPLQHLATGRDGGRGLQGEESCPCCPAEEAELWELDGKVQGPEELQVFTLWDLGHRGEGTCVATMSFPTLIV